LACRDKNKRSEASYLRHFVRAYKKNAASRGIAFDLSEEEFFKLVQGDCYWCGAKPQLIKPDSRGSKEYTLNAGIPVPTTGVDRFDNNQGYTPENSVSCCPTCNKVKGALSPSDFIKLCSTIAKRHS
tara:strand:- start:545 stop:925 length:381 start_codon:yes stop_codon:yes gene_type:complete